jgi:hypothetical protein
MDKSKEEENRGAPVYWIQATHRNGLGMCGQVSSNDAAHAFSNKCTAPRTVMKPGAVSTYVGTRNVYVSAC